MKIEVWEVLQLLSMVIRFLLRSTDTVERFIKAKGLFAPHDSLNTVLTSYRATLRCAAMSNRTTI